MIKFKKADRWKLIDAIRGGASVGSCGKNRDGYDARPYSQALLENYPELRSGDTSRLLADAVARRSSPMVTVAAILGARPNNEQRGQFNRALDLAMSDPDLSIVFDFGGDA